MDAPGHIRAPEIKPPFNHPDPVIGRIVGHSPRAQTEPPMSPIAPTIPRLEYGIGGASSAPALVLINGLGGRRQAWYHQVLAFNKTHRVLSYDQRGLGGSEPVDRPAVMLDYARDLLGLLNHVGIYRAVFVGVSFGGRVAQELALAWPGRVEGLVLVGTSGGGEGHTPGDPAALTLLERSATLSADQWQHGLMPHLFGPAYLEHQGHRLERLARWWADHPQPPAAIAHQWQAMRAFDRWSELAAIQSPCLVVHGTADTLSPIANGEALAARIPGARLESMPGLGHSPHVEDPDGFEAALRSFLDEIGH
jgi:3-oxoadipate enol-lactonase